MLADARRVPAGARLETDVCVIGGGAAGITIARELASRHRRVILLESGGLEGDGATQALYDGEVDGGLPYFPLFTARLRYFGGSTNHWGGRCRPFAAADFERHDWIPNSGWPIRLSDLDGYYERAAGLVQLDSPEFGVDEWADRGGPSPLPLRRSRIESRVAQVVAKRRRSFADAYGDELERSQDATVYLHANVVEIQSEGARATRVRVATLAGGRFTVSARVFVLAAGGIENPRLLLASNYDRPRGLGNHNDVVGRYFLEHPRFVAASVAPLGRYGVAGFYEPHRSGKTRIAGYLALPEAVRRAEELVDIQVRIRTVSTRPFEDAFDSGDVGALRAVSRRTSDDLREDVQRVAADLMTWQHHVVPGTIVPVPHPDVVVAALGSSTVQELVPDLLGDIAAVAYREGANRIPVESYELTTRIDPVPNPDSRVVLGRERDALGMPKLRLEWRLHELDRHSVSRTLELLAGELGVAGLGRMRTTFDEHGSEWPDDLSGGFHHMGTTRMSDDPKRGVVDRDCRVHGVSNLFVAGSSVFSTAGSGTPTITLTALALRLVDKLKQELA
ncbi:MAG TPA: GMC family oxidoreductase [Gaiellaceae bacterium]|nr:GMC family oxidoreductase [Gaiellaceae bacterium]